MMGLNTKNLPVSVAFHVDSLMTTELLINKSSLVSHSKSCFIRLSSGAHRAVQKVSESTAVSFITKADVV